MVLYALIASLPQLKWDEAPHITLEELTDSTDLYLNSTRAELFRKLSLSADAAAAPYLHADGAYETDADRSVREAFAAGNPLEREKMLDFARWQKIEELEFGNRFNFNVLCAYKLKLELLLKWKARDAGQSQKNLDLAAEEVRKEAV